MIGHSLVLLGERVKGSDLTSQSTVLCFCAASDGPVGRLTDTHQVPDKLLGWVGG